MIESVSIRNFKSLGHLSLSTPQFTCLVGLNGSGKSTILQALDLLSQLMIGKIDQWLEWRQWDIRDLHSRFSAGSIRFEVSFRLSDQRLLLWEAHIKKGTLDCAKESARIVDGETLLESEGPSLSVIRNTDTASLRILRKTAKYRIGDESEAALDFSFQGSILSQLRDERLSPELLEFREALKSIRSLELLAPHLMRKPSRTPDTDIGAGGEKLSAYLHQIKGDAKTHLISLLQNFYPQLVDLKVRQQRAGWKRLIISEEWGGKRIETEARHINDGLLRVLAVLAQTESDRSMLLFDEIENGINPEIVEGLVDTLVNCKRQILVTSHSPMILNYLEDEVARKAVQFVYRSSDGSTRTREFFSIPRVGEKLEIMGPGEAFIDTDLVALTAECIQMDHVKASEETPEKGEEG